MKFAFALLALILAALVFPFLVPIGSSMPETESNRHLPRQIVVDGQGGSEVFGLHPGVSTLADVRRALGADLEVAIVAEPNEVGALEGYYAQAKLGFVLPRVIVTVQPSRDGSSRVVPLVYVDPGGTVRAVSRPRGPNTVVEPLSNFEAQQYWAQSSGASLLPFAV